ncbi:MAG: FhaA domain-containing protein [Zhaonellaceae bacterium]|jgi:hypothetical protein|nr:DUF3662 domain-containing protein [Clostridia bacterium]
MSFLRSVEEKLETVYERWIGKIFKGPLKPGEIAGKAIRVMIRNKKVSINKTYVPNYYQINLSKEDYLQIQPILDSFSEEISETLAANAAERSFTILGKPLVTFEINSELSQGQLKINTKYVETKSPVIIEDEKKVLEDTLTFSKQQTSRLPVQNDWSFQVLQGPDKGKKFRIISGLMTIGRKPENDIVLNDSSISRVHARVRLQSNKLTITDLDSTNGVVVNGLPIKESQVFAGDEIILGQSKLLVVKE